MQTLPKNWTENVFKEEKENLYNAAIKLSNGHFEEKGNNIVLTCDVPLTRSILRTKRVELNEFLARAANEFGFDRISLADQLKGEEVDGKYQITLSGNLAQSFLAGQNTAASRGSTTLAR